jgi:integrase
MHMQDYPHACNSHPNHYHTQALRYEVGSDYVHLNNGLQSRGIWLASSKHRQSLRKLCNLRHEDVSEENDARIGAAGRAKDVMHLRLAKTGENQSAYIDDPDIIVLMRALLHHSQRGDLVFPFINTISIALNEVRDEWKLPQRYVFHGLRHGGTTHYHAHGKSIPWIKQRGRWRDEKSCHHYIQNGLAAMLRETIPSMVEEAGAQLSGNIVGTFEDVALQQLHK